jgi:hypothetical protein
MQSPATDKCGNALVKRRHGIEKRCMAEAEHSLTIQGKGIVKLRIAKAELCVAGHRNGEGKATY